jgi:hypothetical protein
MLIIAQVVGAVYHGLQPKKRVIAECVRRKISGAFKSAASMSLNDE